MSSPISGFTAIPNPQMLAFMPIQSYLMMYFAGSGWQYGKRRISAMSNEQFNKLTPEELLRQHSIELKNMLPTLEKSLNDVTPLVRILIEQYGDFIKAAIAAVPQAVQNIFSDGDASTLRAELAKLGSTAAIGSRQSTSGLAQLIVDLLVKGERSSGFQEFKKAGGSQRSTIPGLTVSQVREQARQKELVLQRQRQLELQRRNQERAELAKLPATKPITPQIGTFGKRGAGQSQKLERLRLIRLIAEKAKDSRDYTKFVGVRGANQRAQARIEMQRAQQLLVNLLARYRF